MPEKIVLGNNPPSFISAGKKFEVISVEGNIVKIKLLGVSKKDEGVTKTSDSESRKNELREQLKKIQNDLKSSEFKYIAPAEPTIPESDWDVYKS